MACRVSIRRATANLPRVDVLSATGLNVYSILQREQLIMTVQAVATTVERLLRPTHRRLVEGTASSGLPIPSGSNVAERGGEQRVEETS